MHTLCPPWPPLQVCRRGALAAAGTAGSHVGQRWRRRRCARVASGAARRAAHRVVCCAEAQQRARQPRCLLAAGRSGTERAGCGGEWVWGCWSAEGMRGAGSWTLVLLVLRALSTHSCSSHLPTPLFPTRISAFPARAPTCGRAGTSRTQRPPRSCSCWPLERRRCAAPTGTRCRLGWRRLASCVPWRLTACGERGGGRGGMRRGLRQHV